MRPALGILTGLLLLAILAASPTLLAESTMLDRGSPPLRWKNTSIRIAISSSITSQNPNVKSGTDIRDVIRRSVSAWEEVSDIRFDQTNTDKQSVSPAGVSGDGVSVITIAQTAENLALFQSDWQSAPARTRVFYNGRNEITEADIVLNPYVQFSDDGTLGTFDLESTLTHEIGHLLGLGHSISMGAMMYPNYGRNGLFGLEFRNARTLSLEDLSALRGLYGALPEDDCCGQTRGRLTLQGGKPAAGIRVWAEDEEDGKVAGTAVSGGSGTYQIAGLPAGRYKIYCQGKGSRLSGSAAFALGSVEVEIGKEPSLSGIVPNRKSEANLQYIGINSQLADAAIPVNAGRKYMVYLGGQRLDAASTTVGVTSPFISVDHESVKKVDFNDKVSVIVAEVSIDPRTPVGNYSIFVRSNNNSEYLIGAIAVGSFVNPWDLSPVFAR